MAWTFMGRIADLERNMEIMQCQLDRLAEKVKALTEAMARSPDKRDGEETE